MDQQLLNKKNLSHNKRKDFKEMPYKSKDE